MASSPTPRDELDEKLADICANYVDSTVNFAGYVEAIKRAFKDAGYMTQQEMYDRLKTTLDDERSRLGHDYNEALAIAKKAAGIHVVPNNYMTGQEWYDRFQAELKWDTKTTINQCEDCGAPHNYDEAAKKASGIVD